MPKQNPVSILELGRIINFKNVTLLAKHLEVDPETAFRWRRELVKEGGVMVKYYNHVMIDFEPKIVDA